MTLILRKGATQARIEGFETVNWDDDDYDVVDGTVVARIYRERLLGEFKWRWFLQVVPPTAPNQGVADTLDAAKAAFKKRYELRAGEGEVTPAKQAARPEVCPELALSGPTASNRFP